jgi:hypothetical protein
MRLDWQTAEDERRTTKPTWRDEVVLLAAAVVVFVLEKLGSSEINRR